MKYSEYPYPNFVFRSNLEMPLIPIHAGCGSGEFGCACVGNCMQVIDHLTIDEVKEKNVKIVDS